MAEPVSYEQILREVAIKKGLKPWEVAFMQEGKPAAPALRADSPEAIGAAQSAMVDPMRMAGQREMLMNGLAQSFGTMANPETQMAKAPNPGLIQLLMGLMGK